MRDQSAPHPDARTGGVGGAAGEAPAAKTFQLKRRAPTSYRDSSGTRRWPSATPPEQPPRPGVGQLTIVDDEFTVHEEVVDAFGLQRSVSAEVGPVA